MEIYYYKPISENKHFDIACVQLDNRNSYHTLFYLKKGVAKRIKLSVSELKKEYNYNRYSLMDAKKAKALIVSKDLEMHLPEVNYAMEFGTPNLFL